MKTLTICGSMRFQDEMIKIATRLEAEEGFCVLQPVFLFGNEKFSDEEYENVVKGHFQKIDISDGIYVVNIGGYVGSSTKSEIEYAKAHGKEVIFHEKV